MWNLKVMTVYKSERLFAEPVTGLDRKLGVLESAFGAGKSVFRYAIGKGVASKGNSH